MNKFTTAIKIHQHGTLMKESGNDHFIVQTPFVWYIQYEEKKGKICVPEGFRTDLGSIPSIFRPFFSRNQYVAYILHDFLYADKGYFINEHGWWSMLSRKECDRIMREAIIVEGREQRKRFVRLSAWLQYWGVRLGGWWNWYF